MDPDFTVECIFRFRIKTQSSSMIDYPRPIDKYTRILYYTHVQRQETFPGD